MGCYYMKVALPWSLGPGRRSIEILTGHFDKCYAREEITALSAADDNGGQAARLNIVTNLEEIYEKNKDLCNLGSYYTVKGRDVDCSGIFLFAGGLFLIHIQVGFTTFKMAMHYAAEAMLLVSEDLNVSVEFLTDGTLP